VSAVLSEGRWDLAFPGFSSPAPGLREEPLFTDRFVCVVRRGHPIVRAGGFDLARFRRARHVSFQAPSRAPREVADVVRADPRVGSIAATVPYLLALPLLVRHGDLVATVPSRLAAAFARDPGLAIVEAPPEMPPIEQVMVAHERFAEDPGLAWLRRQLRDVAAELPAR
jgi:DNA-binding transcriptional LysR family regulator